MFTFFLRLLSGNNPIVGGFGFSGGGGRGGLCSVCMCVYVCGGGGWRVEIS